MKQILLIAIALLSVCNGAIAQNYDLVVAKDGSGDYDNIQEAINAIRDYKPEGRQRILVRKGVYEEKVIVPSYKTNISLIGEDCDSTILIWHDHANMRTATGWPGFTKAEENLAQASGVAKEGRKIGTFQSYTLRVDGPGFECENMTVSNDALSYWNPGWWQSRSNKVGVGQAVAVHVEGDRVVFRRCRLLGFQDTVFNGNEDSRQVFYGCYIEGTVDFLFGPATCWYEECELHAVTNGYLTAASTPARHPYGYVFYHCRVTADSLVTNQYLGRPWRNWAAVLYRECELPAIIHPIGWHNWKDPVREKTARYCESGCYGPGAAQEKRVAWRRELSDEEAGRLSADYVLNAGRTDVWHPNFHPVDFNRLAAQFCADVPGAQSLQSTAYVAGTLEPAVQPADPVKAVEPLVMRLDSVDCTTFVEYLSAALLGRVEAPLVASDSLLQRFTQALRYRQGKRGNYASRKHYFSEWISDNQQQGLLQEITATLPGAKAQHRPINFMSTHASLYPQLAASDSLLHLVRDTEQQLSAQTTWLVPKAQIRKVYGQLRHGDIVVFATSIEGLDVFHCGFVWMPEGETSEPRFLHASSKGKRVMVSDQSISDYTRSISTCTGIRVLRLNLK